MPQIENWIGVPFAAVAALASVAGGSLVFLRRSWSRRSLEVSLGFGGGFMLAAALITMVPESLHMPSPAAAELILAGYLFVHFVEHVLGKHYHFVGPDPAGQRMLSPTASTAAVAALTAHTFFDGVAIASAFLIGPEVGMVVLLAVLLHKVPEGFAVSSVALAGGASRGRALGAAGLLGLGTIAGALALSAAGPLAPYGIPVSAGILIHVAASDLIPEVNKGDRWTVTAMVILGGLAFLLIKGLAGPGVH